MSAMNWTRYLTPQTADLIEFVKRYATEHYEDGGWDVVVECWDDDMIAERLGWATTEAGALKKFRSVVSLYSDRESDAINSAF